VHYLRDPRQVRLIAGAGPAIRGLRNAGFACVVVTNQSPIGRGLMSLEELSLVNAEMDRQLIELGAALDGLYFCSFAPSVADRTTIEHPDRKPGPGMLLRAARDLKLDLRRSWMVGDMPSDIAAGRNAKVGGTILVRTGHGASVAAGDIAVDHVVADLPAAAELILRGGMRSRSGRRDLGTLEGTRA
jgi:D-glycero-D-manno-heptose 1,7-bisphosphate phosphatase